MRSPNRRRLVVALALAASLQSLPRQVFSEPVRRICFLAEYKPRSPQAPVWLRDGLKALGFEEGRNLMIECRYMTSENPDDLVRELEAPARELVARDVEVIVAFSNWAAEAALRATRTIPIVIVRALIPFETGLVQSLARPGGNVTGNAFYAIESWRKSFEVLLEAFPKARRAGMLLNVHPISFVATKLGQMAEERHIAFQTFDIRPPNREGLRGALSRIKAASLDVLLATTNDIAFKMNEEIANFMLKARIPTIGVVSNWVDLGGLFYFGPDEREPAKRAPRYVAQLLRGAKAAELAMEQPSVYHLSINMKTAGALGYAIPNTLRIRADRIVE